MAEPEESLDASLAQFTHLNLTEFIHHMEDEVYAHGGFCDILKGSIKKEYIQSFRPVFQDLPIVNVAIKRLRVFQMVQPSQQTKLEEVCHCPRPTLTLV